MEPKSQSTDRVPAIGADPGLGPTPYDEQIARLIRGEIARIWKRVKETGNFTQTQLASALQTSQAAVSRLLRPDDPHPWTIANIVTFCEFCKVDLQKEILDQLPRGIEKWFADYDKLRSSDEAFTEECAKALTKYYVDRGIQPSSDQVARLAAQLAMSINRRASAEDIAAGVELVVLRSSLKHATS
ncbi:hypothetical protein XH98_28500 [Bradyrhizobium sp. CCBAU 51745]|uniref:hypothetical protein n=1 Tax=Bradyrhizobium sp. CCBAU 51745 TaxID=1325099 RepID=UPI002305F6D8|nr:hypothetical protein [Bradyrhizobium sp. CCBAU 51745]MDA9442966.1 hypothetical protein [Bradyrhizobium sp. CCBAU 51745]